MVWEDLYTHIALWEGAERECNQPQKLKDLSQVYTSDWQNGREKAKSRLNVGWAASPSGIHCLAGIYQHTHHIMDVALQITSVLQGLRSGLEHLWKEVSRAGGWRIQVNSGPQSDFSGSPATLHLGLRVPPSLLASFYPSNQSLSSLISPLVSFLGAIKVAYKPVIP